MSPTNSRPRRPILMFKSNDSDKSLNHQGHGFDAIGEAQIYSTPDLAPAGSFHVGSVKAHRNQRGLSPQPIAASERDHPFVDCDRFASFLPSRAGSPASGKWRPSTTFLLFPVVKDDQFSSSVWTIFRK